MTPEEHQALRVAYASYAMRIEVAFRDELAERYVDIRATGRFTVFVGSEVERILKAYSGVVNPPVLNGGGVQRFMGFPLLLDETLAPEDIRIRYEITA